MIFRALIFVLTLLATIGWWKFHSFYAWIPLGLFALHMLFLPIRHAAWFKRTLGTCEEDSYGLGSDPSVGKIQEVLHVALLLILSGIGIGMLEKMQPFYFTQGDNFCQGLPIVLQGCRSFFTGNYPGWNPYQMLGSPTACLGIYGFTYPFIFLSYGISRFLLGNEYYAVEVLASSHILLAGLGTYWACRKWKISPVLALAAALSYAFSGFLLIAGRSWYNYLNTAAWLPWFIGMLACLVHERVGRKWVLLSGLLIGIAFHSGFVQLWVYVLMLVGMLVLVLVLLGSLSVRRAFFCIPAGILGIACAIPLLAVQLKYSQNIFREYTGKGIEWIHLLAALCPYPWVKIPASKSIYTGSLFVNYNGEMYYSGTFLILACFIMALVLLAVGYSRLAIRKNIFIYFALLALVFSFGDKGHLWPLLAKLPGFDKFQQPWRFLIFFYLFGAMGGAAVWDRLLGNARWGQIGKGVICLLVVGLLGYGLTVSKWAFYYFDSRPYPPLPKEMAQCLKSDPPQKPQRLSCMVLGWKVPPHSPQAQFPLSMMLNFASAYALPAYNGYDPLIWQHHFSSRYYSINQNLIKVWRAYGVRWVVHNRMLSIPVPEPESMGLVPRVTNQKLAIYEITDPAPLAFTLANPKQSYPMALSGKGFVVDVSGVTQGGPFIVNYLAWPDFKVYVDGKRAHFNPDEWGRIKVELPAGAKRLEGVFAPGWGKGFAFFFIFAFLGVLVLVLLEYLCRKLRLDEILPAEYALATGAQQISTGIGLKPKDEQEFI